VAQPRRLVTVSAKIVFQLIAHTHRDRHTQQRTMPLLGWVRWYYVTGWADGSCFASSRYASYCSSDQL
jgi:hypothetical protein